MVASKSKLFIVRGFLEGRCLRFSSVFIELFSLDSFSINREQTAGDRASRVSSSLLFVVEISSFKSAVFARVASVCLLSILPERRDAGFLVGIHGKRVTGTDTAMTCSLSQCKYSKSAETVENPEKVLLWNIRRG
ncbi:hypothetical protein HPP92_003195 [Vanilla planifolia]|uniref:Uncharacterized protein n=1 Tax=Vanilla planifolia TaxID=51239 RepID=A0A835VF83_VANPL|nr:hypothetical protein HPP92_003195 [Vanilla planifolia]